MSEQTPAQGPGAFCWNELVTSDPEAATEFYAGLFGWTAEPVDGGPMPYVMFKKGDQPVAGMVQIVDEMGDVRPHWMNYVLVDDIEASVSQVEPLGGTVIQPVVPVGNMGRLAVIQDPTGAIFSFWEAGEGA